MLENLTVKTKSFGNKPAEKSTHKKYPPTVVRLSKSLGSGNQAPHTSIGELAISPTLPIPLPTLPTQVERMGEFAGTLNG
jgi:hypothetical protein